MKKFLLFILLLTAKEIFSQCGAGTPSFSVNLSSAPNATWVSPSVPRADTCCGWTGSDVCIKFTFTLSPFSMGINFGIASGAVPPGALFYSINCGPPIAVGTPICLSGAGPHVLTFCKPGNNANSYSISAIPTPVVPDSITVRNGCTQTLSVSGFSVPTITWNSINPGAPGAYNSYLSCTSGCATVVVTPTGTPPPFVDYVVGGFGQSPCQANYYQDTVRVYFYSNLLAGINPTLTTICAGSTNAVLTATASGGLPPYTYSWSPIASSNTVVTAGPGTYTVKVFDNTGCPPTTATAVVNQYTLPISANAGPNIVICKSSPTVALSGTVTNATGGVWSGGGGTFSPSTSSLTTNYIPTATEISTGVQLYLTTTGNSGCPPKQDTIFVSFQNVPIANAGPNFTVCANNSAVNLNGVISGFSSTGQWSTSGTGAFTSTTNLSTVYNPSAGDAAAGVVNIFLTSTGNGVCPAAKDTAKIFITPSPTVNAAANQTVCTNSPAALNGTVTGPTNTGMWSTSGDGSFSPSNTQLNASYNPGPNDVLTGSVTLVLTSTGNGNCLAVTDTMKLFIDQLAVVNAGSSQTLCSTINSINLNGIVSGGTSTGIWSTSGTGGFTPSNTVLNAVYNISAADKNNGFVVLTLSSTNNGVCPVVTSSISLQIVPLATVSAGPNQVICSNTPTVGLLGSVVGPSTAVWSSGSSGSYNPSNTVLNPVFGITTADINNGFINFTLTATGNAPCPAVSSTVQISIIKIATVTAGPSQTVCSTISSINLNGNVSGGTTTGIWSTSGTGAFTPVNTALNAAYNISTPDISSGFVTLTLSSTNNSVCPVVTSTLGLTIVPLATVSAGPNQVICSNTSTVGLSGTISGAGTGIWSSGSSGSYNPSNTVLNPVFGITTADINNGFINFTLTATGNAPCPAVTSTVQVSIIKMATVTAGPSQTVCSTIGSINLNGNVSGGTTSGIWSTSGTGVFTPFNTALNAGYNISTADQNNGFVVLTLSSTNNGVCPVVTSTLGLQIMPEATVNAGPNQTICSNTPTVALLGSIIGPTTAIWTSGSAGGYSPSNTVLNPVFSITPTDINNGFVTFTLTATNNAPCPVVSQTMQLTIIKIATVTAGPSQSVCSAASTISLSGTVSGGTSSGFWSTSGTGAFNPGSSFLNTSYFISVADVANGFVTFTLSSGANAPCPVVTSTTSLLIKQLATINAGVNQVICSNTGTIGLTGNIGGGASTATWSSGSNGSFSPSESTLTPVYNITSADILTGFVNFTLTSTDNGPCPAVSDSVKVSIIRMATVTAGPDKAICSTQTSANFTGTIAGVSGTGIWNAIGSGNFSPSNNSLNVNYNVSNSDVLTGYVFLILSSTNNGVCPVARDTAKLSIFRYPVINLADDTTVCEKQNPITVGANIIGGSGNIAWTTSGSGSFSNNSFNPVNYNFSATDISSGFVLLTFSSINNGPCGVVSANIKVNIKPSPTAGFSPSTYTAYIPNDPVQFTNTSTNANAYFWDFADGSTSTLFQPIHNYPVVGFYTITLIATNQYNCTDTATDVIKVISDIQFPNAFTPNLSGSNGGAYNVNEYNNDVFFPYTAGVTEYNLMIFNRWGELIFESNDIAVGWDGYFAGKPCQQDAYVWKANVKFFDGRVYKKTGSVTIVR